MNSTALRKSAQRLVGLSDNTSCVLNKYITVHRKDVTDEYGRNPLMTTHNVRIGFSTISKIAYSWSRLCEFGQGCPHGRGIDGYPAAGSNKSATKCPSNGCSHAYRHAGIPHYLSSDVPQDAVSNPANGIPTTQRNSNASHDRYESTIDC